MLSVERVSKAYGPVKALADVSIDFAPGEVHAVVGENGAGKSTLMGVLAGFVSFDSGTVRLHGEGLPVGRPFECRQSGIAMIHQHFTLVPEFTVRENLALARMERLGRMLDLKELSSDALKLGAELGWGVDPDALTSSLPVGAQQRIEILKNLANAAEVLIFDEPTAVLAPHEAEDLFRVIRRLRDAGKTVVFIAHKLAEVMAVADRVTVLRRGRLVAGAAISDVVAGQIAEWMVGDMPALPTKTGDKQAGEAGLEVRNLRARGDRGEECVRGLSLEVRPGEIVGIGGVDGNGQLELAETIAGVRTPAQGQLLWRGRPLTDFQHVGYIPQDRQTDGLALGMSAEDNLLLEGRSRQELLIGPIFRRRQVRSWAEGLRSKFDIRLGSLSDPVLSLSGGNQQKIVVSRVLDKHPELLIVVNPTRGLDLRASAFVHAEILKAREAGTAVLLISGDLDELSALSDRTFFMSTGRLNDGVGVAAVVGG